MCILVFSTRFVRSIARFNNCLGVTLQMSEETYVGLQESVIAIRLTKIGIGRQIAVKLPGIIIMKIPSAVIELLHVHRWTDRRTTKLIGSLLHLFIANPPKSATRKRSEIHLMLNFASLLIRKEILSKTPC